MCYQICKIFSTDIWTLISTFTFAMKENSEAVLMDQNMSNHVDIILAVHVSTSASNLYLYFFLWLRWWKICLWCRRTWVQSLGWKEPLEKRMATHSSILAWEIQWTEKPGRLQSIWSQRETQVSDLHFHFSCVIQSTVSSFSQIGRHKY